MTPDEARALGERWIKAGGGWRDGARLLIEEEVGGIVLPGGWYEDDRVCDNYGYHRGPPPADAVPDPRDPATLGTWLATVRERWGDAEVFVVPPLNEEGARQWGVFRGHWTEIGRGPTEAEALVAALEARTP